MADVLDVIEEIKKLKKIEDNQIKQAQENNFKKKGGFTKRIFLVWSSNDKYKTNESKDEKYLKEKNFKRVVKRVKY